MLLRAPTVYRHICPRRRKACWGRKLNERDRSGARLVLEAGKLLGLTRDFGGGTGEISPRGCGLDV